MLRAILITILIAAPASAFAQQSAPLATSQAGRGTPVVIIPGVLGSAYSFRKVTTELVADDFHVTIIDPLGFGASPRPDGADYSYTAQAARIAETMQQLHISNAILVCHALGGTICLRLAYHHPELVRGYVSINGGASEQAGTVQMKVALKLARVVLAIMGQKFALHELRKGLIQSAGDTSWITDDVVNHYVEPFGTDARKVVRSLQQITDAHEREALAPNLPRVEAPVHLLYGPVARDPKNPALGNDERTIMRNGLRHFHEDAVPGAGEFIQEEQPGVVVAAIKKMCESTK